MYNQHSVQKSPLKQKGGMKQTRKNIRLQESRDQPLQQQYAADSISGSPSPEVSPDQRDMMVMPHQVPEYQHYEAGDDQCRKELPDRHFGSSSSEEMDPNDAQRRVMFEDEQVSRQQEQAKEQLRQNMYNNDPYGSALKDSQVSESDPNSPAQYENQPNYQHFHDESMSKLEGVLQRQRERLENMGGFSGKSSQNSKKTDGTEKNLEDAYEDLEHEIHNIKRNLEASQNLNSAYSPMKINESSQLRESQNMHDYDLSPSELENDE